MFKDNNAPKRLRLLVESESLFNDGVAAVFFTVALAWAQGTGGDTLTTVAMVQSLAVTVGGGILIGGICGWLTLKIAIHATDHLVEAALTTVTAYGTFLLAEKFYVSGVLATVTAGLITGNLGILKNDDNTNPVSEKGRAFILDFWEFAAFLANSFIFLLIGLRVATIHFTALGSASLIVAIVLVIIGRALAVYPLCATFARSRWAITLKEQHILWWGGLRGALALALALALPATIDMHDEIVIATFGVVTFSFLAQGLTMPLLLRKMGMVADK
jgi:CPA1 family monovalent cation:H+ antiporter